MIYAYSIKQMINDSTFFRDLSIQCRWTFVVFYWTSVFRRRGDRQRGSWQGRAPGG